MEKGNKENNFKGESYTKIPNQLLEVLLQINLQNYEIKILLAIARKTYGFNKNSDYINQKQLENLTGIKQSNISRTLKNLIEKKIIIKNGKELAIQKDFKLWNIPEKEIIKNISVEIYSNGLEKDKNISVEIYKYIPGDIKNISGEIYTKNTYKKTYTNKKDIHSRDDPVNNFYEEGKNKEIKEQIGEIINYLNSKADKNFRSNNKNTIKEVKARLNDGFTLEDFKKVIDIKATTWKADPKMNAYLRPETLFGTKFESYLNEKIIKGGEHGKPGKHFENERTYTDEEQRIIDEKFYA